MELWSLIKERITSGNHKVLARAISLVENEVAGYDSFLNSLPDTTTPVIGITGPPGAGKSTITDALIGTIVGKNKKVGIICVDPSSPFNLGALLGDRIRMNEWYNHPSVFIRSLATRGSLGGLHPKIIEITDLMKAAGFDFVIVETVGVGQSEIEIAGLADTTVVVLVPEAGDEIQSMKAGLMEIGQVFVVNKSDRPGADIFIKNLKSIVRQSGASAMDSIEIIKAIATTKEGIEELFSAIEFDIERQKNTDRKYYLLAEKAYYQLQQRRMKDINKQDLFLQLKEKKISNIYSFINCYYDAI